MKELTFNGVTLLYKIVEDMCDDGSRLVDTHFYHPTEKDEDTYRKYLLFGKKITKTYPKLLFKLLNVNIESDLYTRSDIRERISRKLELLNRKEEIERGEIV